MVTQSKPFSKLPTEGQAAGLVGPGHAYRGCSRHLLLVISC